MSRWWPWTGGPRWPWSSTPPATCARTCWCRRTTRRSRDVVWLLRQADGRGVRPSDDDEVLRARGLEVVQEQVFEGSSSLLVLQRWAR